MDYYKTGQKIRQYRKAMGFSQEQLAEIIGISVTHLSHIETGNTKLSLPVLVSLASALHTSTDALLFDNHMEQQILTNEIAEALDGCTWEEIQVITDLVKAARQSLKTHYRLQKAYQDR